MTREEAIKTWLPIISMGIDNMPELKEALDMVLMGFLGLMIYAFCFMVNGKGDTDNGNDN